MLKAIGIVQGIDVGALHPVSHEHDKIHEQKVALELLEIAWLFLWTQTHKKQHKGEIHSKGGEEEWVQMSERLCVVVLCCASDKVNNQRKCVVDMVWLTSGERRQCLFIICTAGWSVVWYRVEGVGKG